MLGSDRNYEKKKKQRKVGPGKESGSPGSFKWCEIIPLMEEVAFDKDLKMVMEQAKGKNAPGRENSQGTGPELKLSPALPEQVEQRDERGERWGESAELYQGGHSVIGPYHLYCGRGRKD